MLDIAFVTLIYLHFRRILHKPIEINWSVVITPIIVVVAVLIVVHGDLNSECQKNQFAAE